MIAKSGTKVVLLDDDVAAEVAKASGLTIDQISSALDDVERADVGVLKQILAGLDVIEQQLEDKSTEKHKEIERLSREIVAMRQPFRGVVPDGIVPVPLSHLMKDWPLLVPDLAKTLERPQPDLERELCALEISGGLQFAIFGAGEDAQPAVVMAPETEFDGDPELLLLANRVVGYFKTTGHFDTATGEIRNYEIKNEDIQQLLKAIGARVGGAVPPKWGFMLMIFEEGTKDNAGANFYICSHNRADTAKVMQEWIDRQES